MKNIYILIFACLGIAFISCKKKKEEDPQPEIPVIITPPVASDPKVALKSEFLTTYANIAYSSFTEARSTADLLKTAINNFVTTPTEANLDLCKQAYVLARKAYLQTEVFRGVSGPIDMADGDPESWLNSWPLNETYIDFVFTGSVNTDTSKVSGNLDGYVNDRSKVISKDELVGLNGEGADDNISIGYHAIEFLLWGQDIYVASAGQRSYKDFLTGSGATAPNGDRRGQYLNVCASLLVENLEIVVNGWKPGVSDNYRADFLKAANADARLKTVVSGMTKMTKNEFGGERILPGIENKDQEEEHSCFSDLTKDDFKYDALGFDNIITGQYKLQTGITAVSGTGLKKLIDAYSVEKGSNLNTTINDLRTKTDVLYNSATRYDQIILKGDTDPEVVSVKNMSDAWVSFSNALNAANESLGFGVVVTTD